MTDEPCFSVIAGVYRGRHVRWTREGLRWWARDSNRGRPVYKVIPWDQLDAPVAEAARVPRVVDDESPRDVPTFDKQAWGHIRITAEDVAKARENPRNAFVRGPYWGITRDPSMWEETARRIESLPWPQKDEQDDQEEHW